MFWIRFGIREISKKEMRSEDMKITYIYHSGFLVETADCYYVFDYYQGELPTLDPCRPILVFASHSHPDHYNPLIFQKLKEAGMEQITAVLSKDIPKRRYPSDTEILTVTFHQTYSLPYGGTLQTLHSTDRGVAFLITCPEGTFYHAGDLNDWTWEGESDQYNRQMTGSYRHEMGILKDALAGGTLDVAFLPLDPRQEKDYSRGMLYFLKKIPVKKVFPMHYWEKPKVIRQFLREYPDYGEVVQYTE